MAGGLVRATVLLAAFACSRSELGFNGRGLGIAADRDLVGDATSSGDTAPPGDGDPRTPIYDWTAALAEQKLLIPGSLAGDAVGWSIALDGPSLALVGAPSTNGARGAAFIVARTTGWTVTQTLSRAGALADEEFGQAVALGGGFAVVGVPGHAGAVSDSGALMVHTESGGLWSSPGPLKATSPTANHYFGEVVAVSTGVLAASGRDTGGMDDAVIVFERVVTSWIERDVLTAADHVGEMQLLSTSTRSR